VLLVSSDGSNPQTLKTTMPIFRSGQQSVNSGFAMRPVSTAATYRFGEYIGLSQLPLIASALGVAGAAIAALPSLLSRFSNWSSIRDAVNSAAASGDEAAAKQAYNNAAETTNNMMASSSRVSQAVASAMGETSDMGFAGAGLQQTSLGESFNDPGEKIRAPFYLVATEMRRKPAKHDLYGRYGVAQPAQPFSGSHTLEAL
jgi:hypothetical protein